MRPPPRNFTIACNHAGSTQFADTHVLPPFHRLVQPSDSLAPDFPNASKRLWDFLPDSRAFRRFLVRSHGAARG